MKRGEKRASLKNQGSMNGEILLALKSETSLHILYYYYISLLVLRFLEFIETENLCRWNVL